MSSGKYATPLSLTLKPSRIATIFYSLSALATLALIVFISVSVEFKLLLISAVLALWIYSLLKERQMLPTLSVSSLSWDDGNRWRLTTPSQIAREASLLSDSVCFPSIVILNFKVNGQYGVTSVVLFNDSTNPESLRKLRVRLQVQAF
jgi:hypothetical protein